MFLAIDDIFHKSNYGLVVWFCMCECFESILFNLRNITSLTQCMKCTAILGNEPTELKYIAILGINVDCDIGYQGTFTFCHIG